MMNRVLDLAILGLLMERDHHGYEIRTEVRERLTFGAPLSFGSIYPALARLERTGLVEVADGTTSFASRLSTGSLSGERASLRALRSGTPLGRRGRKVYRITAQGREAFSELLADPNGGDDSRGFSLRIALAKYLTPALRITLLERRRTELTERLEELRSTSSRGHLDDYARSVVTHATRGVELDLEWVESLLRDEHHDHHFADPAKS
ncbi:MAG: PadR family transcriptional regulator [Acidobacteria bacterium]|nr:PadR family transcriptional regulator [Acidobacteriota bacterium]